MTLAAIIIPQWVSLQSITVSSSRSKHTVLTVQDHGSKIQVNYGLHRRCSNTNRFLSSLQCESFPTGSDCKGDERYFCSMWKSVGFLMSFAVVIEGMTVVAFAILLGGGKQKRESGWSVLAILVTVAAAVQAAGMALIVSPHPQASSH